jgi:hypothetical protein
MFWLHGASRFMSKSSDEAILRADGPTLSAVNHIGEIRSSIVEVQAIFLATVFSL